MAKQTTIQDGDTIRKGSVKVLIGDDFQNLTDIGALRDVQYESLLENQEIEFDNVDRLRYFVKGDRALITLTLAEINFSNIAELDDGLVTLTIENGTEVTGEEQVESSGDWNYDEIIVLENQNGDGTQPTVNSVTGGTDGALSANDDYFVVENGNGNYGILIVEEGTNTTTEAQNVTINYDYTPASSKKLTFAEDGQRTTKVMRLVNTNANGDELRIDLENGTNFTPITIDFAGDNEDEVATLPIEFQADVKEKVDEQAVS